MSTLSARPSPSPPSFHGGRSRAVLTVDDEDLLLENTLARLYAGSRASVSPRTAARTRSRKRLAGLVGVILFLAAFSAASNVIWAGGLGDDGGEAMTADTARPLREATSGEGPPGPPGRRSSKGNRVMADADKRPRDEGASPSKAKASSGPGPANADRPPGRISDGRGSGTAEEAERTSRGGKNQTESGHGAKKRAAKKKPSSLRKRASTAVRTKDRATASVDDDGRRMTLRQIQRRRRRREFVPHPSRDGGAGDRWSLPLPSAGGTNAGRGRRVVLLGASGGGFGSDAATTKSTKLEEWIPDDAGGNVTDSEDGDLNRGQTVVWEDDGGRCEPMADWQTTFHVSSSLRKRVVFLTFWSALRK